ncbi:copper-exporting P-type ATPase A [Pleomorphomonas sp. SM30]|uniref:P-type Zn(2+) transporter n=2 Tax=Oharaeibacter diazotrophicus TaxID=1920512 RepID=A0A4R6RBE4_9HYPH|nr:Cu+-exporting ATPase [Oharaeibacter diazotrophicus]BBE72139.1 copper-exporting P-type ATPase A [Pleomorphomonas sp. SM30]
METVVPGDAPGTGTDHDDDDDVRAFSPMALARIAVTFAAGVLVWLDVHEPWVRLDVIGVAGLVFGGWPIFREAWSSLMERRMTMELSMVIAIAAAASIAEFLTALVILVFVLVAEELEHLTVARGRSAIHALTDVMPRTARARRAGAVVTVAVDDLVAGDRVLVAPGEAIPVDGAVVDGRSHVDQSRITGESMPAAKGAGDPVYAGSVNQAGAIEIVVERVGADTSYGRIVEAVERAGRSRAPVHRLADRLAGQLVWFAFASAAVTFLVTRDIHDTISVVIVAGACGVAAGTPLAILGGIGRSARLGAVVKGGLHLENLSRVDTVVVDKTGTLTFGEPSVGAVLPEGGTDADTLLALAAAAEARSEHPLARAVVRAAAARGLAPLEAETFDNTVGLGIRAVVDGRRVLCGNRRLLEADGVEVPPIERDAASSQVLVAIDGRFAGRILVADAVRPEAAGAVRALGAMGIRTVLLTGDVPAVAEAVAGALGIAEVGAEMLPEDKLARIEALTAAGRVVAMVGDGVNDAPALIRATVGVAMGSGTDVARESADVLLIGNDLARFVETIEVARRTRRVIMQNFAGTLTVDLLGIALAATGHLDPMLAAFVHVSSELVFLLNSARLLPGRDRGAPRTPGATYGLPSAVRNR